MLKKVLTVVALAVGIALVPAIIFGATMGFRALKPKEG
jgi:hypothetical protein